MRNHKRNDDVPLGQLLVNTTSKIYHRFAGKYFRLENCIVYINISQCLNYFIANIGLSRITSALWDALQDLVVIDIYIYTL